jgi:plastocyanin
MKKILIALLSLAAIAVQAQTLTGVKVEPAEAKVGEAVKITADFELKDNATNCNVRVAFGEGDPESDVKINQAKDVPLVLSHTYTKPGTYTVKVTPRNNMPMLKCTGKDKTAVVKVVAPVVAVAAPAAAAGPVCPDGWKLDKKSVSKKTGAFTCTAKANTAAPAGKLACTGTLGYFENTKKGQLGCRP